MWQVRRLSSKTSCVAYIPPVLSSLKLKKRVLTHSITIVYPLQNIGAPWLLCTPSTYFVMVIRWYVRLLSEAIQRQAGYTCDIISENKINQSVNQFYFLLNATSSMPLVLYNRTHTLVWTHTYTYTVKYSTHTSIHTRQPFRRRYNVFFLFQAHTLSHSWTLRAARAFFILGNPSLVLKSPPGVPPSMLQPRQHHSRPTLIQPLVELLSLSR